MTHRVAIIAGVLLAGVLGWLLGSMPSPINHPVPFFLSIVLVPTGVGLFYFGGSLDGLAPIRVGSKGLKVMLITWRLLLVGCAGIVVAGPIAAIVTPPDPYSMLIAEGLLLVVFGIFYRIGLRNRRSQQGSGAEAV
jgi:hypothetical protein